MIQKFFEFNTAAGYQPFSSICLGGNGKIYGTAQYGGDRGSGALFEFDPNSGSYSKKVDFVFNKTGSAPGGTLMQAANGKLYGTTAFGGASNMGVLFEFDVATGNCVKKIDFGLAPLGGQPAANLTAGTTGKLYGMTPFGGAHNFGVMFEYDPTTKLYSKKIDFDSVTNGAL